MPTFDVCCVGAYSASTFRLALLAMSPTRSQPAVNDQPTKAVTKFIAGKAYAAASLCDSECLYVVRIVSRTDKSVRVDLGLDRGVATRRLGLDYDGTAETFMPFGSYSMAPTIRADRLA